MTARENIAKGIRAARKAAKMNVDEVGAALGKSGKTISAWEVGRGFPNPDELVQLCQLFGVGLQSLFGESFIGDTLAPDERCILKFYRSLPDKERRAMVAAAEAYE